MSKRKTPTGTLKDAVAILVEALAEDPGYRESWKANIAMMFKDVVAERPKDSVHVQANLAAERFIGLLCYRQDAAMSAEAGRKK